MAAEDAWDLAWMLADTGRAVPPEIWCDDFRRHVRDARDDIEWNFSG